MSQKKKMYRPPACKKNVTVAEQRFRELRTQMVQQNEEMKQKYDATIARIQEQYQSKIGSCRDELRLATEKYNDLDSVVGRFKNQVQQRNQKISQFEKEIAQYNEQISKLNYQLKTSNERILQLEKFIRDYLPRLEKV